MSIGGMDARMTARLVESLYGEAMLLADEARAWFDREGRGARAGLPPIVQVGLSCEALRVTTRLMHVIAWLLNQRALGRGEISEEEAARPQNRLGAVEPGDPDLLGQLPFEAITLIEASRDLYDRVRRLDMGAVRQAEQELEAQGPARTLFRRLEDAF